MYKWLISLLFMFPIGSGYSASQVNSQKDAGNYQIKDFSNLLNKTAFSNELLTMHFKLYAGYVNNANYLLNELQRLTNRGKGSSYEFGALKRRLGWEFDGMRLHELYFGNLGSPSTLSNHSVLYRAITKNFGSFQRWKQDFMNCGQIRGIGWVVLYFDPKEQKLINVWVNEHDMGHLATGEIILVMDVWEHAYLPQFGLDRKKYIEVFFESIDWDIVNSRFSSLFKS